MIDWTNLPGVEVRRYCGIPLDAVDGVVVVCKNEVIGSATFYEADEVIELEVCQEHYNILDSAN